MDDDDLMYMMMLDLLDDGALAFDDGLGAMSIIMSMMKIVMTSLVDMLSSCLY